MVAAHEEAFEQGLGLRAFADQELVQHALIPPRERVMDQLRPAVTDGAVPNLDRVSIRTQLRPLESCWNLKRVVGIDNQAVIGAPPRKLQSLGSVVGKIDPRSLIQLAGKTGHRLSNNLLRSIGGSGVNDHPAVYHRPNGEEAALDHECLVLYDHAQADGL